MVDLEDYVKGVIPHEMSGQWPLAALEAQAVCARTYACRTTKHQSTYGFDVCNTTDCQVYNGVNASTARSDEAVDNTAGECVYYNGELAETVYHSSDGGATEDAANVWGSDVPYLQGKEDPYESAASIPDYQYTVTYTREELTWVLQNSGYSIGDVTNVYVSEYTPLGNVYKVTFEDSSGHSLTVKGETCRHGFLQHHIRQKRAQHALYYLRRHRRRSSGRRHRRRKPQAPAAATLSTGTRRWTLWTERL